MCNKTLQYSNYHTQHRNQWLQQRQEKHFNMKTTSSVDTPEASHYLARVFASKHTTICNMREKVQQTRKINWSTEPATDESNSP
jgi:hypothetical protein